MHYWLRLTICRHVRSKRDCPLEHESIWKEICVSYDWYSMVRASMGGRVNKAFDKGCTSLPYLGSLAMSTKSRSRSLARKRLEREKRISSNSSVDIVVISTHSHQEVSWLECPDGWTSFKWTCWKSSENFRKSVCAWDRPSCAWDRLLCLRSPLLCLESPPVPGTASCA